MYVSLYTYLTTGKIFYGHWYLCIVLAFFVVVAAIFCHIYQFLCVQSSDKLGYSNRTRLLVCTDQSHYWLLCQICNPTREFSTVTDRSTILSVCCPNDVQNFEQCLYREIQSIYM